MKEKIHTKKVKKRKEGKTATGSIKEMPEMTKMTAKGSGSWLNSRDRRCRQEKLNENSVEGFSLCTVSKLH